MNLPIAQIVADIKVSINNQPIDAALIVLKATDYRTDIQQVISVKIISKFFKNFEHKKVYMVITHCDVEKPTDEFITDKLAAFNNYGGVDIPAENVILFNNTPESLNLLVEKVENGNMQFLEPDQLLKKADEVFKELPGDFAK